MQARDLTLSHIGHLKVCVQQQVKRERKVLAGIVDADVEVQLFFANDESIRYPESKRKYKNIKYCYKKTNYIRMDNKILTDNSTWIV